MFLFTKKNISLCSLVYLICYFFHLNSHLGWFVHKYFGCTKFILTYFKFKVFIVLKH